MTRKNNKKITRRKFLKDSASTAAVLTVGMGTSPIWAAKKLPSALKGRKVIVIGIDGMDPILTGNMMNDGMLPNLARLRQAGGYSQLGSSIPPQSPVAWANFITGAGPGMHGIFDFIHRHPERQCAPFLGMTETVPGQGAWQTGEHSIPLDFWPFNHKQAETLLRRQGTPFWDYLDKAGISSTFYDLPSNYPPSKSKYGNHRCLSGMGTPDLLGEHGGHYLFSEDGPVRMTNNHGSKQSMLFFESHEMAQATLTGPVNSFLQKPEDTTIEFTVHRDIPARGAVIDIQDHRILLKEGQWSGWKKLDFELSMPAFMPDEHLSGICRFYLQEVSPNFRLYVTPVNTDPSDSALTITEPSGFIKEISNKMGLFYTTGFQEDHKALTYKAFTDDEFVHQAGLVLEERLNLLNYALDNYDDGLLFFYFSSTDLQAHMLWWDSDEKHPTRSAADAKKYFNHFKDLYRKMDGVVGDILSRYGNEATVIVMSDHGFANFKRQFNLNTWLRENGYLYPDDCTSIMVDADWSKTSAYGLGINGLYLNLKGRERDGIIQPGPQREQLLDEITAKLEAIRDTDGSKVIRKVHRTDKAYTGPATALAPDLVVGYSRGYRASWETCLGGVGPEVLLDNDLAWSADHCADVNEVPGVIFSNKPIGKSNPSLIDVAPTILTEFDLKIPSTMVGKNIFKT